jgi:hypothetical protein
MWIYYVGIYIYIYIDTQTDRLIDLRIGSRVPASMHDVKSERTERERERERESERER